MIWSTATSATVRRVVVDHHHSLSGALFTWLVSLPRNGPTNIWLTNWLISFGSIRCCWCWCCCCSSWRHILIRSLVWLLSRRRNPDQYCGTGTRIIHIRRRGRNANWPTALDWPPRRYEMMGRHETPSIDWLCILHVYLYLERNIYAAILSGLAINLQQSGKKQEKTGENKEAVS